MEKLYVRTIEPSGVLNLRTITEDPFVYTFSSAVNAKLNSAVKKLIKYYPVYHYVNKVQFQYQCLITLDPKKQDIVSLYVSNFLRFDFFLFFRQC